MIKDSRKDWPAQSTIIFFIVWTLWWILLFASGVKENSFSYLFAATYGLVAAWGGLWGVGVAKKWGGLQSAMGKAILFLSFGLLAEEFGQLVFSFYNIFLKVEIPYPSTADIGFFGSIPLYILGILYLAKASGVKIGLKSFTNKIQAVIIPAIMLSGGYILFLQGYKFDWNMPIKTFLDFGYPLGQAIYISLALLTYLLSRKILGGVMKNRILLLLFAFLCQYIADFNFLFQNSRGTWYNGGYGDYLYFFAYTIMVIGIFQLKMALDQLN